ncbi:MAG: flagellin [Deltaproteobacteria bacterium]|jgi:flagellin|nr:flagellin [Deltaproteobacteria bacterium]MDP7629264.1 flagellin [SAR324 cluster bacterium]
MSLKINTNPMAINAHRNLANSHNAQGKTMERLSSGLKINRGADHPANLQISERLRSQAAGLEQAVSNSEMAVSMVQTAEAALDEVSRALINARQLAVHAANEGVNDVFMVQSDQQEIDNILMTINRVANYTQYGNNNLLDGSAAGNGVTVGDNLEFVSATHEVKSSGVNGYGISITQAATRSEVTGAKPLTQAIIDAGEQITITEGGKTLDFRTVTGRSVEQTLNDLGKTISESGLSVELVRPDPAITPNGEPVAIHIRHREYGSEHNFTVASNTGGVLSQKGDVSDVVQTGVDVNGEINGEDATGRGQYLTAGPGATTAEGVQVRYSSEKAPEGGFAGTLTFSQNSLIFQIAANANQTSAISLRSMRPDQLGRAVNTDSEFNSLREVDVTSLQGAQDSMRVIDRAIEQVAIQRGDLGAFQKDNLESNLNYLRIAHENILSSDSVVRDADMAEEMTDFTRNQILVESGTAMLAQANQMPRNVLALLG